MREPDVFGVWLQGGGAPDRWLLNDDRNRPWTGSAEDAVFLASARSLTYPAVRYSVKRLDKVAAPATIESKGV